MPNILRGRFYFGIIAGFILSFSILENAYSQGCNGADGSGLFTGSIANRNNGTICANNPVQPGLMEIDISNIPETGTIRFQINWDDGSAPQQVNATRIGPNRFFASVTHIFPQNGAQVKCEYTPDVRLVYNGTVCAANLGTPPRFVRWNTDDQQTGDLSLLETATNVNEYQVCAGVETNVTFTDRSRLNCVPPALIQGLNDRRRWRQFRYGTASTITGQVRIGGASPGFPYNGPVDDSPEPNTTSGFPAATTQIITIPATAQAGQFFEITMNYWNTCNSYPANAPVTERAYIRVVSQPAAPTVTPTQTVCRGTTPNRPEINDPPGNNIVSWWRNNPGDTPGTLITSGNNMHNISMNTIPGYTNNNTPGVYKVWVSYRPNIANALNCESPKVLITRTIREGLSVPNPTIAPPTEICDGQPISITLPNPVTETIGGATQYVFSGSTGVTLNTSNANSATFNTNVTFAPGQLYVDRTIQVRRRYTPSGSCGVDRDFTVRIYNDPVGGTPSPFPDICEGTSIGPINLTGHLGTIDRWQIRVNAGPWSTYTGPSSGNSITPGVLNLVGGAATLYTFRAVVENGPCTAVNSAEETVLVSPNPGITVDAGTDQSLCGVLSTNLDGSDPNPGIGTWTYLSSVPAGKPAPNFTANNRFSPFTINPGNEGAYTMRWTVVSGTCTFIDDVVIDIGAPPNLQPLPAIDVCGETANLNAAILNAGVGTWTVTAGPGIPGSITIDDPNSPTSQVSLNGPGFQYGTYTFEWSVTSGNCPTETESVTVTFNEAPSVVTANDVPGICLVSTGSVIPITGTFGGGATTGSWTVVTGDGTISGTTVVGNTVIADYNATALDYTNGTPIVVKLTVSGAAVCPTAEQDIQIIVDRTPVVDAGTTPLPSCENFIQLNAEDPIPFGATGQWTGAGVTFDNSTDPNTIVRNLPTAPGSVTLRWTLTSTGGNACSAFEEITVNTIEKPNATNISPVLCEIAPQGGALTTEIILLDYENSVTTHPAADRSIQWFQDGPPPLGTPIADPTTALSGVPDGKVFVARITDTGSGAGCTNDAYLTVNIRPLPTAIDAQMALCETNPGTGISENIDLNSDFQYRDAITTAGFVVVWYNTAAEAQANVAGTEITAPFDVNTSQSVFARVTHSSGLGCPNIAELELIVNSIPSGGSITGDPTVCMGTPTQTLDQLAVETYQIPSIPGAKYHWTIPQGAGEFVQFAGGGINDFFVILKFPYNASPVPLDISVVVEQNTCTSAPISITITRSATPVSPVVNGLDEVCENTQGERYNIASANPSSDYIWTITRQSDNTEGGAFISAGQGSDEIFVNYIDESINITVREQNENCSGPPQTLPVAVNLLPRMQDNDPLVCSDAPIGITFQPATANPVINHYNILSFSSSPSINFVTPAAGPVAANNVTDTHIQNHAFENLTAVPRTVNYTVVPVSVVSPTLQCVGPSQILTVTIQPEPQLNSGLNKNICSEESTSIRLISEANTFPADKFIVTAIGSMGDPAVLPAGVAPVDPNHMLIADGVTLHDDNIIMDHAFTNTSGSNAVVSYTIVPYSTLIGCPGNPPSPVLLTIHPQTTVDNPPLTNSPYCNGDLVNVEFNSTDNPDANFLWTVKSYDPQIILGSPAAGAGDVSNMIVSNSDLTTSGFIRFGVKGKNIASEETTAGCPNPELLFDVEIKPSPEANNLLGLDACSDLPGGSTYTTDLESLEASVTPDNLDPNTQIDWYQNYPATPITTPNVNAFPMQGGVPVFVEVSSTITGCSKVVQVSYDVHPNVSLQVQNEVDITCFGDNNGEVRVGVLTGTPPQYSFQIKRDTDVSFGPKINVTAALYNFTALQGGDYNVRVEDSEGCFAIINAEVIEPPVLQVSIPIPPLKEISCFGGSDGEIQAIATGGVTPYSYVLTQTGASEPSGIFTNLSTGSYVVQVTDNNGCDANTTAFLAQPTQVVINSMVAEINAYGGNLSCNNAVDGRIDFDATGGNTGDYTYELFRNNGALPYKTIANTPNTTDFFDQLEHGNYLLIAYDAKSCPSAPKFAAINNPQPFDPGVIGSNMSVCSGFAPGEVRQLAPAFGGLGNYQYSWEQSADGTNWFPIVGADQPTYDPPVLNYDPTIPVIRYRRIVTTGLCAPGINNPVEVTINPTPVASLMAPSELCKYDASGIVQLSLSPGAYPVRFDYKVSENGVDIVNFQNVIRGDPATITVGEILEDMTFTFSNIVDFNGCSAADPAPIDINVFEVDADFTLSDTDICSGEQITADWTVDTDISYVLNFGDGEIRQFGANTATGSEAKSYINNSTQNPNNYVVTLQATALFLNNCTTSRSQVLTVGPTTLINLLPGPQDLCSGEFFTVEDKSEGVTASRWYWQLDPADPRVEIAQGPLDPFTKQVENTTTVNPKTIKFIYEAENGNCMGATREFDVRVYPHSVANFTVDNDEPIYTGGIAVVNFTNESTPLETDNTVIDYIWDFDEDDAIITPQGLNYGVEYTTAANKTVKLTAVNQLRAACSSTFSMEINVQLPDLMANFNVTPRASCLPLTIETVNSSAGSDAWEWDLIGPDFTLTSTAREPMWNIATPGTYTVRHRAFMTGNPTVSEATPITIQVFDNPIANFELFQARIYKGTEFPVINRSINASEFSWNFGDHPESENSTSPSPTYRYESEGEYIITLTAFNDHGPFDQDGDGVEDGNVICSDVLAKNIFVQPGGSLKIPNAFTPNVSNPDGSNPGDGTNDIFLPVMDGVEEFTMHIFDRWGTLIFESQDKTKGWNGYDRNGRLMPAGVYVYKVVLRLGDDTRTTKIGDVTLIR